jgi:O-methyltransferase involved in polyketide biosynthesis
MPVVLDSIPETLLWNLYHRAAEARRPDTVLRDPRAVELVDAIDFPFEVRFGPAAPALAQWQALRAACFDREVRRFLAHHPGGTVVALGEGLETEFWRVDQGTVQWVSVDLPEAIALRRELLPGEPRVRLLACSALDERWLDELDTAAPVLVTAQGLLMYLTRADVHRLLETCAARIPTGGIVFDAVSPRLRDRSARAARADGEGYRPPRWTWAMDRDERRFIRSIPNLADLETLRLPRGRGVAFRYLVPLAQSLSPMRRGLLSIMRARLGGQRRS